MGGECEETIDRARKIIRKGEAQKRPNEGPPRTPLKEAFSRKGTNVW